MGTGGTQQKREKPPKVESPQADATSVYTQPTEIKKLENLGVYNELKPGTEVTIIDPFGGFSGLVVARDDKAVYVEAPLTKEWRNFWRARLHKMIPLIPQPILNVALVNLNELDPFGWCDWANKNLAKYDPFFSRIEARKTKKGPVLRYVLYENDVNKGRIKELKVGGERESTRSTQERLMEELGGGKGYPPKWYKGPVGGGVEGKTTAPEKKAEKTIPKAIPVKEKKQEDIKLSPEITALGQEKKQEDIKPQKDIKLSPEITALGPKELLDHITLEYGTSGRYKGKNWIGGASGLRYGEDVAIVQLLYNELIDIGVIKGEKIEVNGKYDWTTAMAIKKMQAAAGVTKDGYFGIDTKTGLYRLIAGRVPEEKTGEKEEEETKPGGEEEEKEKEKPPGEAVGSILTLTREIDRDYVKPPEGVRQLMDNFYILTDLGWISAADMVKRNLNEIDKNWDTDKDTAKIVAGRENWGTKTLTRKNVGVFSWANTKKVLFPYLLASGQEFEFKTWAPLETDTGVKIPAGKVIRVKITEYNELTGEFNVEILAVQDDFTSKKGEEGGGAPGAEEVGSKSTETKAEAT